MAESKTLYRSVNNRQVWGVCGGLAEYFNIDVSIVRVLFVLFTILGGPGLLLYIILAVVLPEGPGEKAKRVIIDEDTVSV